jgi:hypothetical protein
MSRPVSFRVGKIAGGLQAAPGSAQSEIPQDEQDDHNQAYYPYDLVHRFLVFLNIVRGGSHKAILTLSPKRATTWISLRGGSRRAGGFYGAIPIDGRAQ